MGDYFTEETCIKCLTPESFFNTVGYNYNDAQTAEGVCIACGYYTTTVVNEKRLSLADVNEERETYGLEPVEKLADWRK